jgi:hypothetical protein
MHAVSETSYQASVTAVIRSILVRIENATGCEIPYLAILSVLGPLFAEPFPHSALQLDFIYLASLRLCTLYPPGRLRSQLGHLVVRRESIPFINVVQLLQGFGVKVDLDEQIIFI